MSKSIENFWTAKPFPYQSDTGFFDESELLAIQEELLSLPDEAFDRYENPFEKKFTLRDKENFPPKTKEFFEYLEHDHFLNILRQVTGLNVEPDFFKHYWGVHKFNHGDKLDIHVDAGIHPKCGLRKVLTFGLYLSKDYTEDLQGHFEMWSGNDAEPNKICYLDKPEAKIPCFFNNSIIFACTDDSWHGAPSLYLGDTDRQRIFLTMSYMIDEKDESYKEIMARFSPKFTNTRTRAYFPAIRGAVEPEELSNLRLQRATETGAQSAYRTMA